MSNHVSTLVSPCLDAARARRDVGRALRRANAAVLGALESLHAGHDLGGAIVACVEIEALGEAMASLASVIRDDRGSP